MELVHPYPLPLVATESCANPLYRSSGAVWSTRTTSHALPPPASELRTPCMVLLLFCPQVEQTISQRDRTHNAGIDRARLPMQPQDILRDLILHYHGFYAHADNAIRF